MRAACVVHKRVTTRLHKASGFNAHTHNRLAPRNEPYPEPYKKYHHMMPHRKLAHTHTALL